MLLRAALVNLVDWLQREHLATLEPPKPLEEGQEQLIDEALNALGTDEIDEIHREQSFLKLLPNACTLPPGGSHLKHM